MGSFLLVFDTGLRHLLQAGGVQSAVYYSADPPFRGPGSWWGASHVVKWKETQCHSLEAWVCRLQTRSPHFPPSFNEAMIFTISPNSESTKACEAKIGLTKVRREKRPAFEGGRRETKKENWRGKKKKQTKRWYQEGKALEYSRFKSLWENRGNTTLRDVDYKKSFCVQDKKVYDCMMA